LVVQHLENVVASDGVWIQYDPVLDINCDSFQVETETPSELPTFVYPGCQFSNPVSDVTRSGKLIGNRLSGLKNRLQIGTSDEFPAGMCPIMKS